MLTIDEDKKIYLTRGDTAYLTFNIINALGEQYKMADGDTLTFSVKKNIEDTFYAFQKVVGANEVVVILPEDTKPLEYGKYWYDVQLNTVRNEVFTIVEKTGFYVRQEITE